MTTPEQIYVNGVKKRFTNYFAAWLPNEVFRLGDIGFLRDNIFVRVTNLVEDPHFMTKFNVRSDPHPSPINIISESGVSVAIKMAGLVNPALPNIPMSEMGIGVDFREAGGFVLKAPTTVVSSIENIDQLKADIVAAYLRGMWDKKWSVIVRLVYAPLATIIVARRSKSKIEISAKGDVDTGLLDLGNFNLSFNVRAENGEIFHAIGAVDITPLFQLACLKINWLNAPTRLIIPANNSSRGLLATAQDVPEEILPDFDLEFGVITDPN